MEAGKKVSVINKMTTKSEVCKSKSEVCKSEVSECVICCEPYNKSSHLPVECEQAACMYKVCIECVRTYLLSTINEPHCMECKANWSAKFMLVLKKNWLSDVYRVHREKFLCDIELSKIAETMPMAERYQAGKKQDKVTEELRREYLVVRHQLDMIHHKINESSRLSHMIKMGTDTKKEEKKEFFMCCPAVDCNGMLSTQYKCGICELYSCPDCHEVIGTNRTDPHTCDANNVASALAIKKDTKQCPGCHNRIYRVEGCSQMWCTGCHTAFDWNTGRKVVSENLHNPHWLEYQRTLTKGAAPRAPGDVPCGGICTRSQVNVSLVMKLERAKRNTVDYTHAFIEELKDKIRMLHRMVENITLNDVRETRTRIQALRDFTDQRVKYIVGEMSKEQLSSYIFRNDKVRQKNTEMLHIYELLSAVGIDLFNKLLASLSEGDMIIKFIVDQLEEYNKLRVYCNGLFAVISNTYNMSVPHITALWVVMGKKFNSKTLKTVDSDDVATPAPSVPAPGPPVAVV